MIGLRGHMPIPHLGMGRPIQVWRHRDKIKFGYPASGTQEQKKPETKKPVNFFFPGELLPRPNKSPKPGVGAKKENGNKLIHGLKCEQTDTHLG